MRAGELNTRVGLLRPNDAGVNSAYEPVTTYTLESNRWARVETVSSAERNSAQQVSEAVTTRVTMRYHPSINTQWRLRINGSDRAISSIINVDERNLELVIICHEVR